MLKIYNSLFKRRQIFKPLKNNRINVYTCGPTVYDSAHIGNLRAFIFADILVKVLKYNDFQIKWVMNITDVDDKTINGARKKYPQLKPIQALGKFTQFYEKLFWQDLKKINISKPNRTPKATQTIIETQILIKTILRKGYAYIKNGSIYFNLKKYIKNYRYGQLVKINLKKLKISSQIQADEYNKENIQDFALWKVKKNKEPFWNFKIKGKNYPGRPGWHIECSTMSKKYLSMPFDIHSGGIDLKFPHHENEITQNTIAYDCLKPVNFWVHNEHVLVGGEKMAKSFRNFYILDNLIEKEFNPLSYRYLCLIVHYRSKLNFTWKGLQAAQNALDNLYEKIAELKSLAISPKDLTMRVKSYQKKFLKLINNDIDTPKAMALMWQVLKSSTLIDAEKYRLLLDFDKIFGLKLGKVKKLKIPSEIKKLIDLREKYRQEKNWQKADQIREIIRLKGYKIEDTMERPKVKKFSQKKETSF